MKKRLHKKLTKKLLAYPMTNNWNWAAVLRAAPEKAEQCPVLKKFDGIAWWWILSQHPQLADLCNWQNFQGWDWAFLLGFMPQYADNCRWNKLAGRDWRFLLLKRPEFFEKCDIEKLQWSDCKGLLSDSSPLSDTAKEKVLQRYKQFKYVLGSLDGYGLAKEKSQCGKCRFLISYVADCCCLYFPEGIPTEHWRNRKMCPYYLCRKAEESLDLQDITRQFMTLQKTKS